MGFIIQHRHKKRSQQERGSALFLIFIGITIFAALSFSVAQMMRGGGNAEMISTEKAKLVAAEIIDYGRLLRQTVQGMRISNNCADTDISFSIEAGDEYEPMSAAPAACKIFDPAGAGLSKPVPTAEGQNWAFAGNTEIENVGETCGTAQCAELIAYVVVKSERVCDEINIRIGLPLDIDGEDQVEPLRTANPFFTGSYSRDAGLGTVAVAPEMAGQYAACLDQTIPASEDHVFVQVLVGR